MTRESDFNGSASQNTVSQELKRKYGEITADNYKSYVFDKSPKSAHWKTMFCAFVVGGLICAFGQVLIDLYIMWGVEKQMASSLGSSTLVALAAILTGVGVYDKLGRFAGAGSTVPITGFSNAMVAPAVEFRSEGLIYGLGAKMFLIAGPVVVNGVLASVIIALLRCLFLGVK